MANVGGQGQHRLINVHTLGMPKQHATNDESMTKVVDTRRSVGATVDPAQLIPQGLEDTIYLAQVQGEPQTLAPCLASITLSGLATIMMAG